MPLPIRFDSQTLDLSKRIQVYSTVDASPALAAETIIATLTLTGFADTPIVSGVWLMGWAAYTVGTSGTAVRFRIRQTNVAGTVKGDTGALTGSQHGAAILSDDNVVGFDTAPVGVYVLTMQVTAGSAPSTVSALSLAAILIQPAMWQDSIADRNSPQSAQVGKLANAFIATGYLRVYGFSVFSSNAGSQFVLMFDASTLPADTAVPLMAFPVSASANLGLYFGPMGRIFQRGLILCTSSTSTTKTINATADCFFDVEYDWLPIPGDTLESQAGVADQVLTRDGPAAVPMDYQVPQGGELIPLVVNATLDGSAVGTPFYGAVQIIAPSGRVMGTAITSSIAAGASASPTWFPRVGGGVVSSNAPGIILQGYGGTFPAADFTWSGPSFTLLSTGFPANSTFTKISATSALQYHLNGDFVPAGAPDVLSLALVVDGVIEENIFTHVSVAGDIISIAWSKIRGLGGSSRSPLAAGAHTFDVQVSSASNVGNKTILVSTSVDLSVIEYEP